MIGVSKFLAREQGQDGTGLPISVIEGHANTTDSQGTLQTKARSFLLLHYIKHLHPLSPRFSSQKLLQVWRENMMMPPNGVASCVQPGIFQGRYRDVTQPGCQRLVDVYVPPTSGKISGTRPGRVGNIAKGSWEVT